MRSSVRFAILRRDGFTCIYCGGTPPKVLLEVDHIVPKSDGGTDDEANLCTACTDCNRGKGSKRLEEGIASSIGERSLESLRERLQQAREYADLQAEIEEFRSDQLDQVWSAWTTAFGGSLEKDGFYRVNGGFPQESRIRGTLEQAPLQVILDAILITSEKFGGRIRRDQTFAYFWAVVRNKARWRGESNVP